MERAQREQALYRYGNAVASELLAEDTPQGLVDCCMAKGIDETCSGTSKLFLRGTCKGTVSKDFKQLNLVFFQNILRW